MADPKFVGELTGDDVPKLIALVVAKALGIPGGMPKDILAVAQAKLPDVDTCGLAPKSESCVQLMIIGEVPINSRFRHTSPHIFATLW